MQKDFPQRPFRRMSHLRLHVQNAMRNTKRRDFIRNEHVTMFVGSVDAAVKNNINRTLNQQQQHHHH